jgi:phosphoserine phosphatase
MTVKPFSNELTTQILSQIDAFIAQNQGPHFAAFDADGTLWDSDVGENFFQYQIDFCNLAPLKSLDPWKHYEGLKKAHPPDAYLWLAQLCAPYSLEEVREWAQETMTSFPPLVLAPQKMLIAELLKRKIQVFVVSASTHWAVEAAISLVGLGPECALGVKTKVVNGLVTKEQDGSITWREGKRTALLEKTQGVAPIFCSGNSSGDLHLLECSSLIRLAVQTQLATSEHAVLFQDEQKLLAIANERGWLTHNFNLR